MKNLIIFITFIGISIAAEGKIGGVTYFDYTNSEEKSAFNFNRQYFSYKGETSENINFKIIIKILQELRKNMNHTEKIILQLKINNQN